MRERRVYTGISIMLPPSERSGPMYTWAGKCDPNGPSIYPSDEIAWFAVIIFSIRNASSRSLKVCGNKASGWVG